MSHVQRLRVYITETDRWEDQPLHRHIVEQLHAIGCLSTVTLLGIEGTNARGGVRKATLRHPRTPLPALIVAEMDEARARQALALLDRVLVHGTVTMQQVDVVEPRPLPVVQR